MASYVWHGLLVADRRMRCSWISADMSPNMPSVTLLCRIQTVVKIMGTENRPISKSFFMCKLSGCPKSHELNTWVTLLNIKLSGGEAWVSWMNHHHIGWWGDVSLVQKGPLLLFRLSSGQAPSPFNCFWPECWQKYQSWCENTSLTQTDHSIWFNLTPNCEKK